MKVLVNRCAHGFTLSEAQREMFPGVELDQIPRHDAKLIQSFEDGDRRGDGGSTLAVVDVPNGSHYKIHVVDGVETLYHSATDIEVI